MDTIRVIVAGIPGKENDVIPCRYQPLRLDLRSPSEDKGGLPRPFGGKFKPRVGNVPCLSGIDCIQKVEGRRGVFFFFNRRGSCKIVVTTFLQWNQDSSELRVFSRNKNSEIALAKN